MPAARAADACLVLPPRARFAGEALPPVVARALGRGDLIRFEGDAAQALFDVLPRGWPAAAVTREAECHDASGATWVRADPAYVRPDINGARLLAVGETLGLDAASADALLAPLRPLFGDAGMPIDAGSPGAWYLRLPTGAPLPPFASPDDALGADLFDHLPQGPEGRRWRALLSEAQVVLHHHPLNTRRAEQGLAPVNSLWFWGSGALPDRVATPWARIASPDATVRAFATLAGASGVALDDWATPARPAAFDLRHARRLDLVCAGWLEPAIADAGSGRIATLSLAFADSMRFDLRRSQSLRFWRRPLRTLAEPDRE